ncbi:hybrid sensor histidine kinase/response regulator transcription factor [Arachidicoccus soli]|uniref:histidine kinase n=1 Tax=Arachidicoccus soli TaxID=2341117 RepID=A0A386HPV3_9BACT|nr:hybrid sensor histidine kinase/response regulator transcription factor [Arachidicoccus soli]AYD47294.1 hybrid sensor histidine kinase/response regulator [Arachidicoccus soli]
MRFIICIAFVVSSFQVFGQGEYFNFSRLNTSNGLSNNQVNAILKDSDGFLWFGTSSGLDRYDGSSFKIFRKKTDDSTSLCDNSISTLFPLPDGNIWVVTRGEPCIYEENKEKFNSNYNSYLNSLHLAAGNISKIVQGHDGRYWFLYDDHSLYLYSEKNKKTNRFTQQPIFKPDAKISALGETRDGKLWLVYQNGFLQEYDIKSDKIISSSNALQKINKGNIPYELLVDREGDVWVWYYVYGVYFFHPQNGSIRQFNENTSPNRLKSNIVSGIVQDENGLIWVATDHGGITLINKKKNFQTSFLLNDPDDSKSLTQNSIVKIYKDDNGNIWLGTYKQGVNYLNSNVVQFPLYHHQESNTNSLPYDDVNKFVEDKSGNIWIGTNGGGLIYFNRKNNSFKQYLHNSKDNNSLSSNVIISLCIDHEGILWIGTYFGGLNSFDGKRFTHYKHNNSIPSSLADDNIWDIFEDHDYNLWIGTLGGGLDRFDRNINGFEHFPFVQGAKNGPPSDFVSKIIQDKQDNLWIGTDDGVVVFSKGKNKWLVYQHSKEKNSLSNNNIISLLEDGKGRIWIGTREGLNLFNAQTNGFQAFTTSDGLPDNMIMNILEDRNQTLWISTPNGLCNAIPKKNKNGLAISVIDYDETNNLQNQEFNNNAALTLRDGKLMFGGPSGFNIIDPSAIKMSVYQPKIVFTELKILNKVISPGEKIDGRVLLPASLLKLKGIDLKYMENVFSISFASLNYTHSSRERYAYMLEGFNADWLYTDGLQRAATYTNLDPGHYLFKIKALKSDGSWSSVKSLEIIIEPPFWRTSLAYFIYVLIIAGILLLIRRITLDRIHMRYEVAHQRREAERIHSLDQLKTKFFTNVSHEFRTPLSLVIAPLDKIIKQTTDQEQKMQLSLVQRNAKRLLNLVNQLLDFRKMEVQEIKLHPAIGDIIGFCKDISQSFMDIAEKKRIQFSFSSNVDNLEIYFDKDKIEKILFNLLSNAFKYTHDNGIVSIDLMYKSLNDDDTNGTLAIKVQDSGIGIPADKQERVFERFFQTEIPATIVNQGTGIGLAITKEFVKLHNGTISLKSELEKGTCFTVLLPAKKIFEPPVRVVVNPIMLNEVEQIDSNIEAKNSKKKKILIVEDNEDLRFYLKDNLKGQYHIEEACNGKEGWEKIKICYPDLIVSDIMMPLMDGVELVTKIKSETLTAHIPVILLTAMGSEEKELEGLKAGANDYVTKPFTFEILESRISNLIAQQKLLQKRFQKQIEVNPSEITISSVDEKFMQQALEVVEKHMDDPDFSVENFSQEMCMSRVTLYRKILSITAKTPVEFIRVIRLKRAAKLLTKSGMSIAEIAYDVGFNNPKIFSKCFKEEFKITPSQYAADQKDKGS